MLFAVIELTFLSSSDTKINQLFYCYFFDIHALSVYFISITKVYKILQKITKVF
jgi:hypothetical protein